MSESCERRAVTGPQAWALVMLRCAIGWHFAYEGWVKIGQGDWTAAGYLTGATGPLAGYFQALAADPAALRVVDQLNQWGLLAVGIGLILGLFTRLCSLGAMAMLALYYLANPPWVGVPFTAGEGSYLIVNKNLIEFFALLALMTFDTGGLAGIDVWIRHLMRRDGGTLPEPAGAARTY